MRIINVLIGISLCSCNDPYSGARKLVQEACEHYIDDKNIRLIKRDDYNLAIISNDSIYTNVYYFIIYDKDNIVTVADDKKLYWGNDSLCKKVVAINNQLRNRGIEMELLYINGPGKFAVRTRDVDTKYWNRVVEIKGLEDLLTEKF